MGEIVFAFIVSAMAAGGSLVLTRVVRRRAVTTTRLLQAKALGLVALAGAAAGLAVAIFGPLDSGIGELLALACAFQFGVFSWLLWQLVGDTDAVEARKVIASDL